MLFGSIILFTACCLDLSIDNHWCSAFYFCEIHVFAYHLVPFGISIMLSMDEFFDNILYFNQRLRVSVYSLLLFLSSALFIPYYIELNRVATDHSIDINLHFTQFHQLNVGINYTFITIWALIGGTSLLLFLVIVINQIAIQREKQREFEINEFRDFDVVSDQSEYTEYDPISAPNGRRQQRMIPLICSLLMCSGTAILVMSYVVQNANAKYNRNLDGYVGDVVKHSSDGLVMIMDNGIDFADPMICHHFLIAAVCWIAASEAIIQNHNPSNWYQKV